ncbi:hypothetical protein LINPERHAP2_LOCUS41442 [Linum perenne]
MTSLLPQPLSLSSSSSVTLPFSFAFMEHFDHTYTKLANEHVLHTNDHFRTSSFRAIYNHFYLDRPLIPSIHLNPIDFGKYGHYPDHLIANLDWSSLALPRPSLCYPDAVYQFYTNLRLEGTLHRGKFSTFVDGHIIYVTPNLLSQVLALPRVEVSIFHESDFVLLNFNPGAALSNWTGDSYSSPAYASTSALPDSYSNPVFCFLLLALFCSFICILNKLSRLAFFLSPLFLSTLNDFILGFPLEGILLTNCLDWLIERLGIRLHTRFAIGGDTLDIRPQHVLWCIGWSGCPPLTGSGGEGPMDADELVADTKRRLHIWSGVDNASNYASSPEWMI